jgi:Zn-dependent protease with chaperone function
MSPHDDAVQPMPAPPLAERRDVPTEGAAASTVSAAELLAPFHVSVAPTPVTLWYRLGLLAVAVVMVLLPLLYLALIALLGYGVWYHATHHASILTSAQGRGRAAFVSYFGPIVMGVVGVAFMVKPLFAPRPKHGPSFALDPNDQPLLFHFVAGLCRAMRAPVPRRIDVDAQVNASASFRRGALSLLGRDLVLTIGLPLVAGMNLRQLTGVLAHEFGHFAQGSGMRLTYVVRSVNAWFARVVFERDAWDERLVTWTKQASWLSGVAIILHLTQGLVWLTRRILWVLMWVGHVVSGFMLRQMEFDADRYEARVAGSANFARTADRLRVLALASQWAHADLGQAWQTSQLADDLPSLVMANVDQLQAKPDLLERLRTESLKAKTGLFDTHPADRDRVASAAREQAPGLFTLEVPATVLFRDFEGLSRRVTLDYYRRLIGEQVGAHHLVPTARLVSDQTAILESQKALFRYFQGQLLGEHRVFLDAEEFSPPDDLAAAIDRLITARARMLEEMERARGPLAALAQAEAAFRQADQVATLMAAGLRVEASGLKLNEAGHHAARAAKERTETALTAARLPLKAVAAACGDRLRAALALQQVPEIAARLPEGTCPPERGRTLRATLGPLGKAWSAIDGLNDARGRLILLLGQIEGNQDKKLLFNEIQRWAGAVRAHLADLRQRLETLPFPFDHGGGPTTVGAHLVPVVPFEDDLGAILEAAGTALERAHSLYYRIMAALAVLAERLETAAGLPLLPDPTAPPEDGPAAPTTPAPDAA